MSKFQNIEEARDYCRKLPVDTLVNLCSELLVQNSTNKVRISQEQFDSFFSIIGRRPDGTVETRGRGNQK